MPSMSKHLNIADLFEIVADTVPDREAVIHDRQRVSYAELERRANRLAHFLRGRGVGPGDHVALYLYNCNEYLEAMLACFKIRAVPVNVNYRYVQDELHYVFDNADAVACIHHREFVPHIADIQHRLPKLSCLVSVEDGSDHDPADVDSVPYAPAGLSDARDFDERSGDELFVPYTGGTTGMPKGVMWPHRNLLYAALGGGGHCSPLGPIEQAEDIASRISETAIAGIALAPLMHGASWWFACIMLLSGNKLVLNHHRHCDGEQIWDIVARERVNAVQIVGDAMAIPLLDALDANPGRWDLSALFNVGSGGAVFSEAKQEEFKAHFPNVFITNSFGSSEGGQMGMAGERRSEDGLGNVARSDDMDVIVPGNPPRHARPGEVGEFARSGHIPTGYYNDPEKTAETFVEVEGRTWLLTGDEARLEEDGSITVHGRGSNCINSGGEKIYPEEVEQALKTHPDVFDALVVGTPDERWGSMVVAVISVRPGGNRPTLAALQEQARQHIAGYKLPRALHIVDEIPRAPSGKPNYAAALEMAESGRYQAD